MSFPESSKPREYHRISKCKKASYSFWTLDWWHLGYFDLDAKSLWKGRQLAVVHGSCSCLLQGVRLLLPLQWKMWCIVCQCWSVSYSPTSLSLFCWGICCWSIFWSGGKWPELFVRGFAWRIQPGNFQHNCNQQTREVILESGKGETPGDAEHPQLSLESAGLWSLIPQPGSQAQSRYNLIERCPAEKDYGFS